MATGRMTLEDWLDDLCVRFIINLPREDLETVARICFQIEEAHWFYEDFIRLLDTNLPSMSLRSFSLKMFQHCPLLASFDADTHLRAFDEFMQYKTRVPVRGAIMCNEAMDSVVLVRGYKKGSGWGFPKGKINKDEDDLDCAVREVYEETGFDLREAGLIEKNQPVYPCDVTMRDQQVRLYVFRGIPEDTIFETKTRKEIGDIRWYKVSDLPAYKKKKGAKNGAQGANQGRFYMVAPFMDKLRQWVVKQKKADAQKGLSYGTHVHPPSFYDENITDDMLLEPTAAPAPHSQHPEIMNQATRALREMLEVKPPTQGLQLGSPTSNQEAGQALMELLRPKLIDTGHLHSQIPGHGLGGPHTPHEQELAEAPHPQTPHHHHPASRIPLSELSAPPDFSLKPASNIGSATGIRPRPQVHIEYTNPPQYPGPSAYQQHPPVQLVHPQPLPRQVQRATLLRDMASSPMASQAAMPHDVHRLAPQTAPYVPREMPMNPGETKIPSQLPSHPINLLNVLRGSPQGTTTQPTTHQPSVSQTASYGTNNAPADMQQHQHRAPTLDELACQAPQSVTISRTHVATSTTDTRLARPTDKHRAGLLDIFKKVEAPATQSQLESRRAPSIPAEGDVNGSTKQRVSSSSPSMAGAFKTAAHRDGRPIKMNPETNLPNGAHSILARGQPLQSTTNTATSQASPRVENTRTLPLRRHSGAVASPSQVLNQDDAYPQQATHHGARIPPVVQSQLSPSYPYGPSQDSATNPLSLFSGPPSASSLPVPGGIKPRQSSTVEQRNALLSLFGKSQVEGKTEKMTVVSSPSHAPEVVPRSPLASFTSSIGESLPSGPSRASNAAGSFPSRSESQDNMSVENRNILLGFLQQATTKR
ncbi:hypothetical protein F4778DRAFT_726245 [Xylariomycetidae sp. FL2044]|nr:hypothetical protein F4778DRAFT_726245 [Xylariomycetidae sp. FL2044]